MSPPPVLSHSPVLARMGMIRVGPPKGQQPVSGQPVWRRMGMAEVIQHAARRGLAAEVRRVNRENG